MRILLVNDDGIEADGIWALYDFLAGEHDVTVCAPDRQCSGFSHSITIAQRLRVRRHERGDGQGDRGQRERHALHGMPSIFIPQVGHDRA